MATLVAYDSSDEDEDVQKPTQVKGSTDKQGPESNTYGITQKGSSNPTQFASPSLPQSQPSKDPSPLPATQRLGPIQGPALGPALGLAVGPAMGPSPLGADLPPSPSAQQDPTSDPPRSPYSQTRSLLQDLTLPPVPNTVIPPSPPGSPPPALTAKFDTFLSLKETKAIHFNAKLASNKTMRNPGVMDKLLGFVGVETSFDAEGGGGKGWEQYQTTLPKEVWDPEGLPAWAYKTPLRRAQERVQKERERRKGEAVEFVGAGTGAAGSRGGTPGQTVPPVTGKRKTRFDN